MPRRSTEKDFWRKVNKGESCWIWSGFINPSGYGYLRFHSKLVVAHRLSWKFTNGNIPEGLLVLHSCDNRKCVNPKHLFLGTHADNMRDMKEKGRRKGVNTGENNGRSKLDSASILEIREMYSTGNFLQREIAVIFGVSQVMISRIILEKNWNYRIRQ